jgi:hypothetical protein
MLELRRVTIKEADHLLRSRFAADQPSVRGGTSIDLTTTPATDPIYRSNFNATNGTPPISTRAGRLMDELEMF